MRMLSLDPGKLNSWWTLWAGRKLTKSGQLDTPTTVAEMATRKHQRNMDRWLRSLGMGKGDEVVIERYMHRAGSGGNVVEVMNALIFTVAAAAARLGCKVVLYTASAHKNSYKRFHTEHYPRKLIRKLGKRHGTWRPRLKRTDPCEHVMDAATLGCYRILKREGII